MLLSYRQEFSQRVNHVAIKMPCMVPFCLAIFRFIDLYVEDIMSTGPKPGAYAKLCPFKYLPNVPRKFPDTDSSCVLELVACSLNRSF